MKPITKTGVSGGHRPSKTIFFLNISIKSTISQKRTIGKLNFQPFPLIAHLSCEFGIICTISVGDTLEKPGTVSPYIVNTISTQKIKIEKIWKLIFHSYQQCAHMSCKYGLFWGERGRGLHILISREKFNNLLADDVPNIILQFHKNHPWDFEI